MLVVVSHLSAETRAPTPTHESIPAEIGYLERGHLACYLPELAGKENDCPGKLKSGPCCNGDKE